jgi:hypothetical protein
LTERANTFVEAVASRAPTEVIESFYANLARDVARLLAELEAPGATGPAPRPLKL